MKRSDAEADLYSAPQNLQQVALDIASRFGAMLATDILSSDKRFSRLIYRSGFSAADLTAYDMGRYALVVMPDRIATRHSFGLCELRHSFQVYGLDAIVVVESDLAQYQLALAYGI